MGWSRAGRGGRGGIRSDVINKSAVYLMFLEATHPRASPIVSIVIM